jgi:hypothetical protein
MQEGFDGGVATLPPRGTRLPVSLSLSLSPKGVGLQGRARVRRRTIARRPPLGGEDDRVERRGRFLYTSDCDPGQDADYSGAESFVEVEPFLDANGLAGSIAFLDANGLEGSIAFLDANGLAGSIAFPNAGAVQLGDDAGIIVDACEPNAWDWASASDSATSIPTNLASTR